MELLESDDPVKSQLLQKSSHHREALGEEVKEISDRTEKIVTNALIIGGALALTYYLVRQFSSGKKAKHKSKKSQVTTSAVPAEEEEEPASSGMSSVVTQIGTALASQASVFLLSLAKEKLTEYLESQAAKRKANE
ncbi:MAG: hypothetical protein L0Y35_06530, partial [Flammeovirgaceae bacterium]|nr:hypothetical protein [Flammeovirgaceae bacterium]